MSLYELHKKHYQNFTSPNQILFFMIIIFLLSSNSLSKKNILRHLNDYYFSEIHLVIKGSGPQNILSDIFIYEPSEVLVNGISQGNTRSKTCTLTGEENNVTLRFEEQLETCENMFYELENIIKVDFTNFDSSKVTDMNSMFYNCSNLEKVIFGDFNTSSVKNMFNLFYYCTNLTSVDLSNFDTSSVTSMRNMFFHCYSLKKIMFSEKFVTSQVTNMNAMFSYNYELISLNLSSFDTSKVTNFVLMFNNCKKLRYLDLTSFSIMGNATLRSMFNRMENSIFINLNSFKITENNEITTIVNAVKSSTKFCASDSYTETNILINNNFYSDCSNICFIKNIKLDIETNECIQQCSEHNYEYECNNICYNECPEDTYSTEDTPNICYEKNPGGYYLDIADNIYKSCYQSCEYCYGPGDKTNHNCKKCKDGLINLVNDNTISENNCYEKCTYYYYFDSYNNYICTIDYVCPEAYNKLIKEKNKCIDDCRKEDIYQKEFNNTCIKECPEGTVLNETSKVCYFEVIFTTNIFVSTLVTTHLEKESTIYHEALISSTFKEIETNKKTSYIDNQIEITPFSEGTFISEGIKSTLIKEDTYRNERVTTFMIKKDTLQSDSKIGDTYETELNINNSKENEIAEITTYTSEKKENLENETVINSYDINEIYISESNTVQINILNLDEFLQYLQRIITNGYNTTDIDNGNDYINRRDNVTFTISSLTNQRNKRNKNSNETTIDLGKCESILRQEHNISIKKDLYILKVDEFLDGLNIPKVEYEIYYPLIENQLKKANLSLCSNIKIEVSIPVNISQSDLDIHNSSSDLYNDICYPLKTESGTDICLKDRREEFVKKNLTVCEENCEFSEYDFSTKRAVCSCFTKIELPLISHVKVDKDKLFNNFVDINNIANIKVLKCVKKFFKKENIFNNSANYLMAILFSIGIIAVFVFAFSDNAKIKKYLNSIWLKKELNNDKTNNTTNSINTKPNKNIKEKTIQNDKIKVKKIKSYNEPPKAKNKIKKKNPKYKDKIKHKKDKNNKSQIKIINNNKNIYMNNPSDKLNKNNNINIKNKNQKKFPVIKSKSNFDTEKSDFALKFEAKKKGIGNENKISYTDIEMNLLSYEEAVKNDFRTYCQYYVSLLKTKHILIFTFCGVNDYNSQVIKIYIFFFTFAINYTVSAMFYNDDTMHKIYIDDGSFDFTYQLPKMIYSLIISSLLKIILGSLGLYGQRLIEMKNMKKKIVNKNIIKESICITNKIILFFLITFLLLIFMWIYLGCFCFVYKNTQIHLLMEVTSSFSFSFITSLLIYLLPGIFRILSLEERKGDKAYMFKFSKLLQML